MAQRKSFIRSGYFFHYATCLARRAAYWCSTWRSKLYLAGAGIPCGAGCTFGGVPIIRRYPESSITIGARCAFLSSSKFNFIGINHPCILSTHNAAANLTIGSDCGFSGTAIGCALSVQLGDRVRCGANTIITDTDWHTDDPRSSPDLPVVIEDDVWLGVNAVVLKGVRIGAGSIIGAGSVVTADIPAGVIAAGVPARTIKEIAPLAHLLKGVANTMPDLPGI